MRLPTLIGLLVAGLLSISFAHAEDLTTQQKFDALAARGIFADVGASQPSQDQDMTRAQFARVAALLLGLDDTTSTPQTVTFTDVPTSNWVTEGFGTVGATGNFEGNGDSTFNPGGVMTLEQLARVLTEALGLPIDPDATVDGTASDWAQGHIAAAVKAGLLPSSGDYTQGATRADLVVAAFDSQQSGNPPAPVEETNQNGPEGGSSTPDLSEPLDFINQQPVLTPFAPIQPGTIADLDETVTALISPPSLGEDDSTGLLPTQVAMIENNTGNEVMMDDLLAQAIERQNNGTLTGFYAGGFTGDGGTVGGTIQLNAELGGGRDMFDGWMDFKTGGQGRMELLDIGTGSGVFANSSSSSGAGVSIGTQPVNSIVISGEFFGANADGDWMWQGVGVDGGGTFNATYR